MMSQKGFTLIELMVVVSIIGILAAIAVPRFSLYKTRAKACEAYSLFDSAKKDISGFYDHTGRMPVDNRMAGLPDPEAIRGKYVESLRVENGAVVVALTKASGVDRNKENMWFYPAVVKGNPTGPLFWIRNIDDAEPWMDLLYTDVPSALKTDSVKQPGQ